jgi:hypothetical protein
MNLLSHILLVFSVTIVYLLLIIFGVRSNPLWELFIWLGVPLIAFGLKKANQFAPRVRQLFIFETMFGLFVLLSILSIKTNSITFSNLLPYAFVLFFVVQMGGFFIFQINQKKYDSAFASIGMFVMLMTWFGSRGDANLAAIDPDGRFFMWGSDAPLALRWYYTIWVIKPLLVDSLLLPKLTQAVTHLATIALCWWSQEYVHIRLLTACHLFMLDGIFGYTAAGFLKKDFCSIPEKHQIVFKEKVQPIIRHGTSFALIVLVICTYTFGLNLGF